MTREEFVKLKVGDEVDLLNLQFERSYIKRKVLKVPKFFRVFSAVVIEAKDNKSESMKISNNDRLEFWKGRDAECV